MIYLYIKSFHLIFIIAWMVSLLYLPRLFVYHSTVVKKSSTYNLFLLMEVRLIKIIAIPAMILTYIFGLILLHHDKTLIYESYFIIKLILVLLLTIYQVYLILIHKMFKARNNKKSDKFYKVINEIPTILMIIVILLVVLRPNIG